MKYTWILLLLFTAIAIGVQKDASAEEATGNQVTTPSATSDDTALAGEVRHNIANDKSLSVANLDVKVDDGIVRLYGTLPSQAEVDRIVENVRKTNGVRTVQSYLKVAEPEPMNSLSDTPAKDDPTISNKALAEEGYGKEDESLTKRVQAKLDGDASIAGNQITVESNNGVVTLKGTIATVLDQQQIVELVQSVQGVKEVKSELIVEQE